MTSGFVSGNCCMGTQRGIALVMSLLMLALLSVIGAALLSATSVDTKIAGNYRTHSQAMWVARAGTEAGREALRAKVADSDLGQTLTGVSGVDFTPAIARLLPALVATDDLPLLPAALADRTAGHSVIDTTGTAVGTYHVWLRNDPFDGEASSADTNNIATLLSIGRIGDTTKTIQTLVHQNRFPILPAVLTLDGGVPPGNFSRAIAGNFSVSGYDAANPLGNPGGHAIGVISGADRAAVVDVIDGGPGIDRSPNYYSPQPGPGPTFGDVSDVSADLDPRLTSVSGLESFVNEYQTVANNVYNPGFPGTTNLTGVGGAGAYPITVVNGDASISAGDNFGTLIVRGDLTLNGDTNWDGLILVIGTGRLTIIGGGAGRIRGAVLVAQTRDPATRDAADPLGRPLATRGNVDVDLNGGGSGGFNYDTSRIRASNDAIPFLPLAVTEW